MARESTEEMIAEILRLSGSVQTEIRQLFTIGQTLQIQLRREWPSKQREAESTEQKEGVDRDIRRQLTFAQTWIRFAGSVDAGIQRAASARRLLAAIEQDRVDSEQRQAQQTAVVERRNRRQLTKAAERRWPESEDFEALYGKGILDDGHST